MSIGSAVREQVNKKVIIGSLGTVIEWYDFMLFGYMAHIVADLFFPASAGSLADIATWTLFGLAFVTRPLGGLGVFCAAIAGTIRASLDQAAVEGGAFIPASWLHQTMKQFTTTAFVLAIVLSAVWMLTIPFSGYSQRLNGSCQPS
jgi:hypothetical protein